MRKTFQYKAGFTIVELLIVIVVIGILASVSVAAYSGVRERSKMTKIKADLATISKAVKAGRINESKTLYGITGSSYSASGCVSLDPGTDMVALPSSNSCWDRYRITLDRISTASGIDIRKIVDPWGRPYFIDENEGENATSCNDDVVATYSVPVNGGTRYSDSAATVLISKSGFSGCSI